MNTINTRRTPNYRQTTIPKPTRGMNQPKLQSTPKEVASKMIPAGAHYIHNPYDLGQHTEQYIQQQACFSGQILNKMNLQTQNQRPYDYKQLFEELNRVLPNSWGKVSGGMRTSSRPNQTQHALNQALHTALIKKQQTAAHFLMKQGAELMKSDGRPLNTDDYKNLYSAIRETEVKHADPTTKVSAPIATPDGMKKYVIETVVRVALGHVLTALLGFLREAIQAIGNRIGIKLFGQNLSNTNFEGYNLNGMRFKNANLQNCNFRDATLMGSQFENCRLTNANFEKANLTQTHLKNCNIKGINIRGAVLTGSSFERDMNLRSQITNQNGLGYPNQQPWNNDPWNNNPWNSGGTPWNSDPWNTGGNNNQNPWQPQPWDNNQNKNPWNSNQNPNQNPWNPSGPSPWNSNTATTNQPPNQPQPQDTVSYNPANEFDRAATTTNA